MRNAALQQTTTSIALINALKGGDEHAMRQLYDMYYKPIRYFAFRLVDNTQDAEDIAVESFIKVWTNRMDFDTIQSVKSFLYTVARNACLNLIRDRKRRSANEEVLLHITDPTDDYVLNRIVDAELHEEIRRYIERLPKKPRRILKEVFLNGKKVGEVSEELAMPVENVQNNKCRGIHELRNIFAKNELLPFAAAVAYILMSIFLPR